ncbi:hypothetical protein [Priestia koreensis]
MLILETLLAHDNIMKAVTYDNETADKKRGKENDRTKKKRS